VTGVRPRHGDVGKSSVPPVSSDGHRCAVDLRSGIRTKGRPHALRALSPAPRATRGERAFDVPGISVTDRAEVWSLSDPIVTEVRPRTVPVTPLPRKAHVPGASWGSQPARTPMRRPGHPPPDLGRPPRPRTPPVPSQAPARPFPRPARRGPTSSTPGSTPPPPRPAPAPPVRGVGAAASATTSWRRRGASSETAPAVPGRRRRRGARPCRRPGRAP